MNPVELSWEELKRILMKATEEECEEMLDIENKGPHRSEYLRRIHGRLNKLRKARERAEMGR